MLVKIDVDVLSGEDARVPANQSEAFNPSAIGPYPSREQNGLASHRNISCMLEKRAKLDFCTKACYRALTSG